MSHVKEVESLLYFFADIQEKLMSKGLYTGYDYACLSRIRLKCRDLMLKMYAEDSDVMLMNDTDLGWLKLIVGFDQAVVQEAKEEEGESREGAPRTA